MSQHTPSLSFEVFPPNPEVGNAKLLRALANMQELALQYQRDDGCFSQSYSE